MDSGKQLLNKINALYQKPQLSSLEKDLLLDYIRQFYDTVLEGSSSSGTTFRNVPADLEEANKSLAAFGAIPYDSLASEETDTTEEGLDPVEALQPEPQETLSPEALMEEEPNDLSTQEAEKHQGEVISKTLDLPEAKEAKVESLEKELPPASSAVGQVNSFENKNIRFELPVMSDTAFPDRPLTEPEPQTKKPDMEMEEGNEEEVASTDGGEEPISDTTDIKPENPIAEGKTQTSTKTTEDQADFAKIFNYNSSKKSPSGKDIRRKIGINDKYLFLNELFASQKKIYEQSLDTINQFENYEEALAWVKEKVVTTFDWDEEEETVKAFYQALHKHFSDK